MLLFSSLVLIAIHLRFVPLTSYYLLSIPSLPLSENSSFVHNSFPLSRGDSEYRRTLVNSCSTTNDVSQEHISRCSGPRKKDHPSATLLPVTYRSKRKVTPSRPIITTKSNKTTPPAWFWGLSLILQVTVFSNLSAAWDPHCRKVRIHEVTGHMICNATRLVWALVWVYRHLYGALSGAGRALPNSVRVLLRTN
jgi:hypothetical protein